MKLLITGASGLLGGNLIEFFVSKPGWEVIGTSRIRPASFARVRIIAGDLADADFAERVVDEAAPDVVINTVALVDLERCESEPDFTRRTNVTTAENLARALGRARAKLIHISTDHLFAGTRPFYSEADAPEPVNNYGRTKLDAERVCLEFHDSTAIVRTNFYGWCRSAHRPTFGEWMYHSLRDRTPIKLFTNYFFTPIETDHLAEALAVVVGSDFNGVLNIVGAERLSKYDFAVAMAEVFGFDLTHVEAVEMDPASFAVRRQADLSLSTEKFAALFDKRLPRAKEGLIRFRDTMPSTVV